MPARRIAAVISPLLAFVRWMFSAAAPGVDLFLALVGTGWLGMMVLHAATFDQGNFRGMQWMSDRNWIVFLAITATLHWIGLVRLHWTALRVAGGLLTSWFWIMIAISLTRISLVPGSITYGLIGALSLSFAIYISGTPRRDG